VSMGWLFLATKFLLFLGLLIDFDFSLIEAALEEREQASDFLFTLDFVDKQSEPSLSASKVYLWHRGGWQEAKFSQELLLPSLGFPSARAVSLCFKYLSTG